MSELFLKLLNMSLKASYVILAVIIIRFFLKKAPKKYSYALWLAAAFRLVCPVSFQSVISLFAIRFKRGDTTAVDLTQVVSPVVDTVNPQVNVGVPAVNNAINSSLPAPTPQYSANPMQIIMYIAAFVWLLGIAAMVIYAVVTYIRLHRKLRFAVKFEDNVYETDIISSPFIMGFFRPKIYIPKGIDTDKLGYVLQHERTHIKRFDHVIKPLAFLILAVHWFNPLVWLSFYLMSRDMEMSCDEKVLLKEDSSNTDYSTTLLSLAVKKRFPSPSPLAFGESGVKKRIKNALKFKKPAIWISIIAVVVCIAVIFICTADPRSEENEDIFGQAYAIPEIIYMDGKLSYLPATDDSTTIYISENGWIYEKGWAQESGWTNCGKLKSVRLTKSNFDDYFLLDGMMWGGEYNERRLRFGNKNAWELNYNGNLYYILQQRNGEMFYVVISNNYSTQQLSVIGEGISDEFCVRLIYKMATAEDSEHIEYSISGESYVPYSCLYMSPLSSFAAMGGDSGYRYIILDNNGLSENSGFVMINRATGDIKSLGVYGQWQEFPYTEDEWNDLFAMNPVDISGFKEKQWLSFDGRDGYALAKMDDQLWFVDFAEDLSREPYMWSIYSLVPEEYMGSDTWVYSEGDNLKIDFEIPGNMTAVCTESGISASAKSFGTDVAWSNGSLYWSPLNKNGELVYNAQIYFTSDSGYAGAIYITGAYLGEKLYYNVTTTGTGLHLEGDGEGNVLVDVVDYQEKPSREPMDFTVDNTGEDFFRYEDIEGRTMTMYKDYTNASGSEYSFRSPAAASECAQIVVIGEIVDKYYVDGNSVNDVEGACVVYNLKISQSLRGEYITGDMISVVCYGGYYRWYLQSPQRYEAALAGNPKYAGMGEVGIVIGYGGIPEMKIGEKYVMFLHGDERAAYIDGARMIVGGNTGVYRINDDNTVSRYVDAETIWEYGTLEELIQEVEENPFNEDRYHDMYLDFSYYD